MRGWPHAVSLVLLWSGVGLVAAAGLGMLLVRGTYDRLHITAMVTSVGAPLIGAAMVLRNGQTFTSGIIVVTVVLLLVSGPVLASETARVQLMRNRSERAARSEQA